MDRDDVWKVYITRPMISEFKKIHAHLESRLVYIRLLTNQWAQHNGNYYYLLLQNDENLLHILQNVKMVISVYWQSSTSNQCKLQDIDTQESSNYASHLLKYKTIRFRIILCDFLIRTFLRTLGTSNKHILPKIIV